MMAGKTQGEVTVLLSKLRAGDNEALGKLVPLLYSDLRRIAANYMRYERQDHTLQPTALLHEAYLKMADDNDVEWQNRGHFIAVAAQVMRRILIDHARAVKAEKRGGGQKLELDEQIAISPAKSLELMALDEALTRLEQVDPVKARVVELQFFGGLSIEETAKVMNIAPRTVRRYWVAARSRLYKDIAGQRTHHGP